MQLVILVLMLAFALGCFVLSWLRDEVEGGYAMLAGFVIILLTGIILAATGMEYQTGSTESTPMMGTSVTTYDYTPVSLWELAVLSLTLIVTGFWGTLVVVQAMREA